MIIFGKKERESFERQRSEFSGEIQKRYDDAKTYHDGKWVIFDVDTPERLEEIKKLISIKKKPNREPFLKACALKKELAECRECADFPCIRVTSADCRSMIHTEIHFADEITWGILPYVSWQYEERG